MPYRAGVAIDDDEPFGHLPDPPVEVTPVDMRPASGPRKGKAGVALAGALTVLGDVLVGKPPREQIPHVTEASGEPMDPGVDIELDPDSPAASRATIRPWLLKRR